MGAVCFVSVLLGVVNPCSGARGVDRAGGSKGWGVGPSLHPPWLWGVCLGLFWGLFGFLAVFSGLLFWCCSATEWLLFCSGSWWVWFPGVFWVPFVERRVGPVWMVSPVLFSSFGRAMAVESVGCPLLAVMINGPGCNPSRMSVSDYGCR